MEYIIVQAGGIGSRLKYLTENKPKALVPINNLPMLFHLFQKYPDKRFVIIADYKKEVMREYLSAFADVKYLVVDAKGSGTCSGVRQAIELIPAGEPFMLIWSDLILPEQFELPEEYLKTQEKPSSNYIGISQTFTCRWKFENGKFMEEPSVEHGVAGLFLFADKSKIEDVPVTGEFVRWIQDKQMKYKELGLSGTKEFGVLEEYEKIDKAKCRPFNQIIIEGNQLIKKPVDEQGEALAIKECAWYSKARENGIEALPIIYDMSPLRMEYIQGKTIYECDFTYEDKREILKKLILSIRKLHDSESVVADAFSIKEAYFNKTFDRLAKIQNLVPFGREKYIVVNGKKCRNVYFYKHELEQAIEQIRCDKFVFIHGDCTFSNMLIRKDGEPVLIDPRGYFGYTKFYGDARYDWVKLYYSIIGNYDRFNLRQFQLHFGENAETGVQLEIQSNHWEDMENDFFELTGMDKYEIKLLHAVIWLSLTTYVWQDYDSICGAFYNGLYYLEEVL